MESPILRYIILCAAVAMMTTVSADSATELSTDTGIYRFHCNVDGAEVFIDGQLIGSIQDYTLDVPVNITGPFYRTYTLQKEGYKTYSGVINSVPKKGQVIHIYVVMNAQAPVQYGTVHLLVTPSDSEVIWDGSSAGKIPSSGVLVLYNVMPGSHSLVVQKEGYEPYYGSVSVSPNEVVKFPVTLPLLKVGSLSVDSVPAGAAVSVDGQYSGVTPLVIRDLPAGKHTVSIATGGYQEYVSAVEVTGGATATVSASLVPATSPSFGGQAAVSPLPLIAGLGIALVFAGRKVP